MSSKRELSKSYKERRRRGGVYIITNTRNGKYILGSAADLASVRNRFDFAVATGSAVDPRLREDWNEMGPGAFALEVREELEQKPDQTETEFRDDLRTLEQLWRAQLDATKHY